MKKFIAAVLCAGLIAVSAAGCGYSDALDKATQATETTADATTATTAEDNAPLTDSSYEDDLEGLHDYFVALGYIAKDTAATDMDAALIGAKQGKKYVVSSNVTIELYEYDTENLNDTAKEIIASVEKDGTFTILELAPVKAYLSDSGKYLMIYNDKSIDDKKPDTSSNAYVTRQNAIDDFKSFHK